MGKGARDTEAARWEFICLRALAERCSGGPAMVLRPDGDGFAVCFVNGAMLGLLGRDRGQVEGVRLDQLCAAPPQACDCLDSAMRGTQARCAWTLLPGLLPANALDPNEQALLLPVPGEDGDTVAVLLELGRDADKESRIKELLQSEQRLRTIFHSVNDAIFVHEQDGTLIDVNDRMLEMYRVERHQAMGMSILKDFSCPDNPLEEVTHKWELVCAGEPQFFPWRARRPLDGSVFDVEVYLRRVPYQDREVVLATVRDISERRKAEAELRAKERKYRMLYEQAAEGIMLMDGHGRILEVNPRAQDLLGFQEHELLNVIYEDLLHPEDLEKASVRFEAALAGETVRIERRLRCKNDGYVSVDASARSIGPDLIQVMFHDLTERKRLEEQMDRARRMAEEANAAKGEFLANISHELRTPISGILGMAEMTLAGTNSPEQRQYLESVKDSARALMAIVNDLLDISKIEAHKLELRPEAFNPRDMLSGVVRTFFYQAETKGVNLDLVVDEQVPHCVRQDSGRLGQVLRNLIGNAVKFTEQGEVRVTVEPMPSGDDPPRLLFAVRDTGIGIAEDKQGKLFQSFTQADGDIGRKYGGTGLGLAISKRLVGLMGGVIWLESRPGKGSTFQFTMQYEPCSEEERDGHAAETATPGTVRGLKLLLVEDNMVNRTFLGHFLAQAGHEVHSAAGGEEALDVLAKQDLDVVLMDVQMPRMDGLEATRRLRRGEAGNRNAQVPVIALTAYATEQDHARILEAGMDELLAKPVELDDLYAAVARQGKAGENEAAAPLSPELPESQEEYPDDMQGIANRRRGLGNNSAVFADMAHGFLQDVPGNLAELEQLLGRGDLEGSAKITHSLVNSAIALGAGGAAKRLNRLERDLRGNHGAQAGELFLGARQALETVLAYLGGLDLPPVS